jgi:hypothetical protein
VAGVVRHHVDTRPADLLRFVAGGILLHDLVVVPLALVGAYLLNRAVPVPWRRWVQVTLVVAAPLALFAYPMVRGFGRIPGNPTVLPHDYATNLALVVTAVVAIVAALATTHRRRPGPSRRTAVPPASESSGRA